jgi:hypothetical protein
VGNRGADSSTTGSRSERSRGWRLGPRGGSRYVGDRRAWPEGSKERCEPIGRR